MTLYIGLMSVTSLDGVDGVLADLQDGPAGRPRVLAHRHLPLQTPVQQQLLLLNRRGDDELHRAALAGNELMQCYASVVAELLRTGEVEPAQVRAIGAHGQTVRHRPQEFDALGGYTLQLMNGALLAELCGIDVVCDFRSRDLAAGGQGAPLVPALHAALFASAADNVAVLNLGGIANLTLLPVGGEVLGFDCGPGNALLAPTVQQHLGTVFDDAGRWAASGHVDEALLQHLLAEPYLARPPPKSTGRDLFHMPWLQAALQQAAPAVSPVDVQATLTEFSARAAIDALQRYGPRTRRLLVCGGGVFNAHLMQRLATLLPQALVQSTAASGMPPQQVEALAFAWLAQAFVLRQPGNLPSVTGARGPRLLGALYPAR